jgi:hypothetical protein
VTVARRLLPHEGMPRTPKHSHEREVEELEREDVGAPRVDEIEPDDRAQSKLFDDEEDMFDDDDDDDAEDLDLDDLAAMEGPDA